MDPVHPIFRKALRRQEEPSQGRYLTFSCFRRRPFLSGRQSPLWLCDALEDARRKHPFQLWAYVFMPEHVHLLILPNQGITVPVILHKLKPAVTRKALRWVREHRPAFLEQMKDQQPNSKCFYRFWQRGGGYDRNIWSIRELYEKIDYIHANPVRRGLVEHPGDWPWSSWRAWHEELDIPIRIDRESLPPWESPDGLPRH